MASIFIFGGPNGSGKSTLKPFIEQLSSVFYINPDELSSLIIQSKGINLSDFGLSHLTAVDFIDFVENHPLRPVGFDSESVKKEGDLLHISAQISQSDYFASLISDFIRNKLVEAKLDFSFESVLSGNDKVDFVRKAREKGYEIFLFFVCTSDPEINVKRVAERVRKGGHNVPSDLIRKRYHRVLSHLPAIVAECKVAYLLDNSKTNTGGPAPVVAIVTDAENIEWRREQSERPFWIQNLVDNLKLNSPPPQKG